jgi:hypothetical protein
MRPWFASTQRLRHARVSRYGFKLVRYRGEHGLIRRPFPKAAHPADASSIGVLCSSAGGA